MLRADLEQIIQQAIIDCFSDLIVMRLQSRQKRALVLFTATEIGLQPSLVSLQHLREQGWRLDVILAADISKNMAHQIEHEFEITTIAASENLASRYAALLVPTLSLTVAAKSAQAIRDCGASQLLANAFEQGLRVVVATDSCCPDMLRKQVPGFNPSKAYQARLRKHLADLQSYGTELVAAAKLAVTMDKKGAAVTASSSCATPVDGSGADIVTSSAPSLGCGAKGASAARISGPRLFSRSDALQYQNCDLRVAAGVLVTPLAADELRSRNVRLIKE